MLLGVHVGHLHWALHLLEALLAHAAPHLLGLHVHHGLGLGLGLRLGAGVELVLQDRSHGLSLIIESGEFVLY